MSLDDKSVEINSAIVGDKKLLPGIHGLRGMAAFGVILFHLSYLAQINSPVYFPFIRKEFGYGVHLFFVVSAFSLMNSTFFSVNKHNWCLIYFIKRFFRIAPLFYFVLAIALFKRVLAVNIPNVFDIILNLTFTFGVVPWIGIVNAGWTIGVEVIFYALLPIIIIMTIRTKNKALFLMVVTVLISVASGIKLMEYYAQTVNLHDGNNWSRFSFSPNMCFFSMGIYAFFVSINKDKEDFFIKYICPIIVIIFLYALLFTALISPLQLIYTNINIIGWGVIFFILCVWQSVCPSKWCANYYWEYLGERSYSMYLLHPIVILALKKTINSLYDILFPYFQEWAFFICAIFILSVVLLCSELTYQYIELPGIKYGKLLIQKINRHSTGTYA